MILPLLKISPTIPFLLGLGMTFSALGSKLSVYCALYLDPYFISVHYQASCPSNTKLFQFLVHTQIFPHSVPLYVPPLCSWLQPGRPSALRKGYQHMTAGMLLRSVLRHIPHPRPLSLPRNTFNRRMWLRQVSLTPALGLGFHRVLQACPYADTWSPREALHGPVKVSVWGPLLKEARMPQLSTTVSNQPCSCRARTQCLQAPLPGTLPRRLERSWP